jgi:hypothetical protein
MKFKLPQSLDKQIQKSLDLSNKDVQYLKDITNKVNSQGIDNSMNDLITMFNHFNKK